MEEGRRKGGRGGEEERVWEGECARKREVQQREEAT